MERQVEQFGYEEKKVICFDIGYFKTSAPFSRFIRGKGLTPRALKAALSRNPAGPATVP
jgi:hypothetical protein